MVREIVHDPFFLGQKSEAATEEDLQVAVDLLDTLRAYLDGCEKIYRIHSRDYSA